MRLKTNRNTALLYLTIILVLTSACNPKANNNADNKLIKKTEQTPINFIGHWLNEGAKEEIVRDVSRKYEFENQHISINLTFPEEIYFDRNDASSNQKFVADICKEENPKWDIVMINNDFSNIGNQLQDPNWGAKYLVDFSTIPEFRENTLAELVSDSVKALWGGIIPGPFVEGVNYALFYNKKLADKIGIKVKQFDMTFDDFLGYIKAVDDYNKKTQNSILPIYEAKNWKTVPAIGQQLYISALDNPSEIFSDTLSETKLQAWHKTLKSIEKLAQHNALAKPEDIQTWDKGKMMAEELCLFYVNGSWMHSIWNGSHPDLMQNFIPTEFPTFKTNEYYIGEFLIPWGVLKNAPHRDEAVKFLLAWNSSDVAQQWVTQTKSPTGIKATIMESPFGSDPFENYANHINKRYGTKKLPPSSDSRYIIGNSSGYRHNFFQEVIHGQLTADEAFEKFRASVNN